MKIQKIRCTFNASKYILAIFLPLTLFIACQGTSWAAFLKVYGATYGSSSSTPSSAQYCTPDQVIGTSGTTLYFVATCSLNISSDNYVPVTGGYSIVTEVNDAVLGTNRATLSSTEPLSEQNVTFSGATRVEQWNYGNLCFYIYGNNSQYYRFNGFDYTGCKNGGRPPIPPTPPAPPSSCTINNSNALNVNMGTLDRAQLVTVPGTGSAHHIQIPVECTGGSNVPVNMTLSYNPRIVSGKEIVQSSAYGLGVTIIYNGKPLSTTDVTPMEFVSGSNVLDLAFEAVRDPNIIVGDVPTGAFTASATVIMTQQ